ncbi:hypothetical protein PC120_g20778 [Phytophthora cactorum]|nr:hypothetical protein PC120_g20778 [Phytophthora cactorum]
MEEPQLVCVSLSLPERIKALSHVVLRINELLKPETIDAAVYNDCQYAIHKYGATRKWTAKAMDGAATRGRLDLVKWLSVVRNEGSSGDTSTLRVLLRENCSWYYVGRALEEAASKGLVDVVKLLLTVKLRQASVSRALKHAVASEHIEVVKLLADLCSSTELRAAYPNIMTGCNVKAAELLRKTVEGREVEEKWGYFRTQHKTLERMKASHDITRNPDKSVSFCGLFRSW